MVKTGVEVLIEERIADFRGRKVGLITNPTGVLPDLRHEVDVLAGLGARFELIAVFGPEHGFRGAAQAGASEGSAADPKTGLPVYDTYHKRGQALADVFASSGVDVVMFDIQDAGARFYTYIWTLFDCMEAAALSGKAFAVLDRPNPIAGLAVEGPVLRPAYSTFVGRQPIALRHGMTVGELAGLFNGEFLPRTVGRPVPLTVIPMAGWTRDMTFDDTGLPWVPPSPNMPTPSTATVYPGTGLFEGTNLSEGRGTTLPFELIGAPYIDGRLAERLNGLGLPEVRFREAYFAPTFGKYAGETIGGVQLYVGDRRAFDPIRTALAMIIATKDLYGAGFAWRGDGWIDKLAGSDYVRLAIDAGEGLDAIVAGWQDELRAFGIARAKYLIYR